MASRCYGCMKLKGEQKICPHCGYYEGGRNLRHQLAMGTLLQHRYEIGRVLGQGGFGITYLAWDHLLEIPVAIKECYPWSITSRDFEQDGCLHVKDMELYNAGRDHFLQEARTLAKLREEPGIVRVDNVFEENGTAYIVMEYVDDVDLREYVQRKGKLSPRQTLELLGPVMDSLECVHNHGLIHRDISPDNIRMKKNGQVRLLDFGAAKEISDGGVQVTQRLLKYGYAPLEQYQAKGRLGPWTDVYALCATAYYCMTGQVPPEATERLTNRKSLGWNRVHGLTPGQLYAFRRGTAMQVGKRIGTMGELKAALGAVRRPGPWRWLAPSASAAALAAAALLVLWPGSEAAGPTLRDPDQTKPPVVTAAVSEEPVTAPASTDWRENVLMASEDGGEWMLNLEGVSRRDIRTATFLDTLSGAPEDAADVSEDGSGRVLAWVEDGSHLVIAGQGGINGRLGCKDLFRDFINLKQVELGGALHTEETTDLSGMFARCFKLDSLDLSGLDVSQVSNVSDMFAECGEMDDLELGRWNTSASGDGCKSFMDTGVTYRERAWNALFPPLPLTSDNLSQVNRGDIVTLGAFEQDGNTENGKEAIRWKVLEKDGNELLLISEQILACRVYHENSAAVTWETSSLREWLNGKFLETAFWEWEQELIVATQVSADRNPVVGNQADPGNPTEDRVYLLSLLEVKELDLSPEDLRCTPTAFAVSDNTRANDPRAKWWWTRTPGKTNWFTAIINSVATAEDVDEQESVNLKRGVRPVIRIQLN